MMTPKTHGLRSRRGFALAVVILVATVALVAVTGAATLAVVSGRTATSQERRATDALLAAESGINTFVALNSATGGFGSATQYQAGQVAAWLDANNGQRRSATFTNGAGFTLQVFEVAGSNVFTLRSEGTAVGGSRQVVLQDFRVSATASGDSIGSAGALVTQQGFGIQGNAAIAGRSSDVSDWIWVGGLLSDAYEGEYIVLSDVLYRVTSRSPDGKLFDLVGVDAPFDTLEDVSGATSGDLIPFAVAEDINVPTKTTFEVSSTFLYTTGMTIFLGGAQATVTSVNKSSGEVTVQWASGTTAATIDEGTPIRARVPSVVYDDGRFDDSDTDVRYVVLPDDDCPSKGNSDLKDGCAVADLSNLWADTFGTLSPDEMLGLARCETSVVNGLTSEQRVRLFGDFGTCVNSYYGPNNTYQPVGAWPTNTLLSGVTWIDGANTGAFNSGGGGGGGQGGRGGGGGGNNNTQTGGAICGSGVVILNTGVFAAGDQTTSSINLNVSNCPFTGVLYVIGDVSIQGNLESFSGTIIVQTATATDVRGTSGDGYKATYDPIAVRRALSALPTDPSTELRVAALPSTFRFGQ